MTSRMTAQDASYYYLETSNTPMHVGSLAILEPPEGGLDYESVLRLVEQRLPEVPRYRKKVREVAFGLSRPVWVDDRDFDITYHVRRSALPKPGSDEQLHDLVARLVSRPLDRTRPLWEMYLVEGLANDRVALFTKSHSALVDGEEALDIVQVLFDKEPVPREVPEELWMPEREPSESALLVGALAELVARPGEGIAAVRSAVGDLTATLTETVDAVGRIARTAAQSAPETPLNTQISRSRRFSVVRSDLEPYRKIHSRYGCTINDVVLAVLAGALRYWLLSRGEPVTEATVVRAMVPMSVYIQDPDDCGDNDTIQVHPQGEVSSFLLDLPVGEPNAVVRLSHIAHAGEAYSRQRRRVAAQTMVRLSGFAPATMHAVGTRVAMGFSQRMFNLMITNAPGPQHPLYLTGARLLEIFPVSPLLKNQALSIALTSYDGKIYYGLNADRDAMPDVDVAATLIQESLEELTDAGR
ncbi:acyltransferase, WS/DGAT/MGAT [Rhodococcus rhodochrous J3]|uniref:Diacylglycerol O-acyltransferase n=1 Tax=Rhodococcus rhodochrous J3 TaxID=903528 RepID=A0ABY1M7W7_RHORH|nr:wax ester/triacylglycerol synthase family O-acyltransferase [Rhodococcus rhodochrous]MBF4477911.1 wax ester/triacylglycerol synthase family O-acyltransferase [Rhodococcus rhodochrous]MCD2096908.1 wax ester/triacylglycerol synthase family O-acyltransferase [Rhodococcus rhodochrous]MCD2121561.1 wax ester/triacylglycerol synthase family O-acyltransferase [Rhodococcus rhodochrous]MCQ4135586.1 wax ester/triacylglycerol synthase family O-acyltransferase [Rhodococcus rhodochrous]MDJ0018424.1 wax e